MTMTELDHMTPEEIERNIATTRASLKGKLNELEHRLSPGERMHEMRQHFNADAVAPWAAVGAIATGTALAMRGLRRRHTSSSEEPVDETVCIDIAVPIDAVP